MRFSLNTITLALISSSVIFTDVIAAPLNRAASLGKPKRSLQLRQDSGYGGDNGYPSQYSRYGDDNSGYGDDNGYPSQYSGYGDDNEYPSQSSGYGDDNGYPSQSSGYGDDNSGYGDDNGYPSQYSGYEDPSGYADATGSNDGTAGDISKR